MPIIHKLLLQLVEVQFGVNHYFMDAIFLQLGNERKIASKVVPGVFFFFLYATYINHLDINLTAYG